MRKRPSTSHSGRKYQFPEKACSTLLPAQGIEHYALPPLVAAAAKSWKVTAKSIMITSALSSLVSLQILTMSKPENDSTSSYSSSLRIVSYGSLFLNLGGTASAALALDNLGTLVTDAFGLALTSSDSLPACVHAGGNVPGELLRREKQMDLLREFGIDRSFKGTTIHLLVCFGLGIMALFVQAGMWLWHREEPTVAGIATGFLVLGAFGFMNTIVSSFWDAVSVEDQ